MAIVITIPKTIFVYNSKFIGKNIIKLSRQFVRVSVLIMSISVIST